MYATDSSRSSLEQCRNAYNAMMARQPKPAVVQAVDAHPFLEKEKFLLEREPETRAQLEEERRRVKPGLVYKTSSFWEKKLTGYDSSGVIRQDSEKGILLQVIKDTFDGVFYTDEASTSDFPILYRGFARAYGRRCSDYLEHPIKITLYRTETDQFGFETKEVAAHYFIEKSFYEKFNAYDSVFAGYLLKTSSRKVLKGASVERTLSSANVHHDTMDTIVSGISCTSATMRQLRRNIWLRAHDQPSLQDSGEAIPGAAKESETHILEKQIADFESTMSDLKRVANRDKSYSIIEPPTRIDGDQGIEIVYLYNYYARSNWPFESHLKTWLQQKDAMVRFVRVPAASSSERLSARAYFAAEELGMAEQIHDDIFEAIHVKRRAPSAYRLMGELFAKHGVDAAAYDAVMRSPGVIEAGNRAEELHSRYSITELPVLLVNGKYEVSTATCRCGPAEMLTIAAGLAKETE